MNEEDKNLFQEAKKAFKINSLKELAIKMGRAETSAINWYKTGFPKSLKHDLSIILQNSIISKEENIHIPLYDVTASAGLGLINEENIIDNIVFNKSFLKTCYGLTSLTDLSIIYSRGDSMAPTIAPLSYLLVQKGSVKEGEICIARINDELVVKRLQKFPNLVLLSDNPNYQPISLEKLDYEIIGSVVGTFKKL
ncbi:S24 family peptidase [Helicobacter sp. 13S00477-4]|uniref:S24 family peptidase n=1 Tax=Helicobacter sp. 13S00477-4 TaxID=1905759 RepID=UPI000BA7D434|nr:S24 family peptidase [Helicobacter sp. 13S00477-4]PAF50431.1 hypothetical protein BKH44_08340 [Helicobacter sp. 13S00477-4]